MKKKHRASGATETAGIVADGTSTAAMVIAGIRAAAVAVVVLAGTFASSAAVEIVTGIAGMAVAVISARVNCPSRPKASV